MQTSGCRLSSASTNLYGNGDHRVRLSSLRANELLVQVIIPDTRERVRLSTADLRLRLSTADLRIAAQRLRTYL